MTELDETGVVAGEEISPTQAPVTPPEPAKPDYRKLLDEVPEEELIRHTRVNARAQSIADKKGQQFIRDHQEKQLQAQKEFQEASQIMQTFQAMPPEQQRTWMAIPSLKEQIDKAYSSLYYGKYLDQAYQQRQSAAMKELRQLLDGDDFFQGMEHEKLESGAKSIPEYLHAALQHGKEKLVTSMRTELKAKFDAELAERLGTATSSPEIMPGGSPVSRMSYDQYRRLPLEEKAKISPDELDAIIASSYPTRR